MSTEATPAPRLPGAEPFEAGDGAVGVLLCHGFTSTPQSMRPWAEHLLAAGAAVSVPLLPGHGTTWQQLNATPWTAWYAEVERALDALAARCDRVAVAGMSMGGALALRLAQRRPDQVAALTLVNPCIGVTDPRIRILPVLRLLGSLPAIAGDIARPGAVEVAYDRTPLHALHSQTRLWADVRAHLSQVRCPTQVFRSVQDHVVDGSSLALIQRDLGVSPEVTLLSRSYHVATLDLDADLVFDRSTEFLFSATGAPR